jgi:8-oxo-dGTP diphosphatase
METKDISRPVPVVRLIIPDASGRVLVLQRAADSTDGGRWCLPGGKIDYGDTVEQAAIRELLEETNLRATNLSFLFFQDSLPPAPGRMHCINLYFRCAGEGEVVLNEESVAAAWIGPDDLAGYALSFRNGEALARYWAGTDSGKPVNG